MFGNYTNQLQAAVLFDGTGPVHPSIVLNMMRMELLEKDIPLSIVQESESFVFMRGAHDLFITVEFLNSPVDHSVMQATLGSGLVNQMMPDARDRVARCKSHALIEVRQGVLPDLSRSEEAYSPEFSKLLATAIGQPGKTLAEFEMRCDVMATICRWLLKENQASCVHWTPSNLLVGVEHFELHSSSARPGMLTVHPNLFGGDKVPGFDNVTAGFYTQGAADFVGREIHVVPAPVPWIDQFEAAMVFIKVANMPDGYIVPDDDTFGIETGEFSYRVRHFEANTPGTIAGDPHFRLTLERHDTYEWTSDDFKATRPIPAEFGSAAAMMDVNDPQQRAKIDEMAKHDRFLQSIGGRLSVSLRDDPEAFSESAGKSPPNLETQEQPNVDHDGYEADRPLDPNDPIDRAILDRLRERAHEEPDNQHSISELSRANSSFGRRKGGFGTRH